MNLEKISNTNIFSNFNYRLFFLVSLSLALNFNTLFNDYVLDDSIVIQQNKFVTKGIVGIPDLLTHSYFEGYEQLKDLAFTGGRYRPLTLVVFALEYQFFGANPFVSHLLNLLLYTLLIALLYNLLQRYLFRNYAVDLAFVTTMLFVLHPIHSEVVANVKSRDELLTFLFLLVALSNLIQHLNGVKKSGLWLGYTWFFLALLTRETAVTFVLIAPLVIYFFFDFPTKKIIFIVIGLSAIIVGYLTLRFSVVGTVPLPIADISNAPFLYANPTAAFATKIFLLLHYIQLLLFPFPLSFEYGYNQIPYIEIYSFRFIASIAVLVGMLIYALRNFNKKSIIPFCILYFFSSILLVSNLLVDIGTPLSERLAFQASLSVCILAGHGFLSLKKITATVANGLLLYVCVVFAGKTITRNAVWKNYETLVLTDVHTCPNSVRINQFAMNIYLLKSNTESNPNQKNKYLRMGAFYGEKMLAICPEICSSYMNLGYTYFNLSNYSKATELWIKGCALEPTEKDQKHAAELLSTELYKAGNGFYEQNNIKAAILCYQEALRLQPENKAAWYNLGGNYFLIGDSVRAQNAWIKLRSIAPYHAFNKKDFSEFQ